MCQLQSDTKKRRMIRVVVKETGKVDQKRTGEGWKSDQRAFLTI